LKNSRRAIALTTLVIGLTGCMNLNPPTRYAPCNNWGRHCHWHRVNHGVRYPALAKVKTNDSGGATDTFNAAQGASAWRW
jgi:hypothetical protein